MRAVRFHRSILVAVIALAALAFAPGAFARGHHTSFSIGFSGPGYSIGYSDWGRGHGHWGASFYPSYGYGYYDSPRHYGPYRYPRVVDRGYWYSQPSYYYPGAYSYPGSYYYPSYSKYDRRYDRPRPVTRRVVRHVEVRHHDGYYDRGSYRNHDQYDRRDRAYGRSGYYDRD